jgi:hypothetical protein
MGQPDAQEPGACRRALLARLLFLFLLLFLSLLLAGTTALAQERPPHVPTEEQLREKLEGKRSDLDRDYQRESVHSIGQRAQQAASWVRERLSSLHITPARLLLGLGILGIFYTWNKNKKKVQWAVLSTFSLLLVIFGAAALIFGWVHLN